MNNRNFTIILIVAAAGILFAHFVLHNNTTHTNNVDNKVTSKNVSENTVEVKSYAYSPQKLKVKKGTTITWENFDLVPHTVTKTVGSKAGPDSKLFGKGEKFSYTFSETGTYEYFCKPHPYMKGAVEVTE